MIYIASTPENPGAPTVTTRPIDGAALKRRIETALGKSVDSFTASITFEEAQELGRILFE